MKGVTPIDHAADVGIDVQADSLAHLFSRAAAGMTGLLLAEQDVDPTAGPAVTHAIEVDAPDSAALLVAWLRELLYMHTTQSFAYVSADFVQLTDTHLRARVSGVTQDDDTGGLEIKGVTYHGLHVSNRDGEWRARIIFDV